MIRLAAFASASLILVALSTPMPARAQDQDQDAADLVVRLSRLEGQVRQLSGQVEQLQFENRQLKDTLAKFQADVDFRFQERGGGRSGASATPAAPPAGTPERGRPGRRGDAFDPGSEPGAPGAPRQLGSSAPLPGERGAGPPQGMNPEAGRASAPLDLGSAGRGGASTRPDTSIAAAGTGDPRADYDAAYAYFMQKHYEDAEMAFRRFLQSHPRDRLVPDATYWLGESYLYRNRAREAAEQFLKFSTDYSRSPKAPEAMLKLGVSLSAMGAKDQACATFAELGRKFPEAGPSVRNGLVREEKRARCPT